MSRAPLTSPCFVEPMVPVIAVTPPEGDGWLHEIKYDGYRTILAVDGERNRAYSRNGLDWSAEHQPSVTAAVRRGCQPAILDGEAVVQDERGVSDFAELKSAITWQPERLVFFAFDLLMHDGNDLRNVPLVHRRQMLEELLSGKAAPLAF